jgi:hypothetical protein
MKRKIAKPRLLIVSFLLLAAAALVSGRAETPGTAIVEPSETRCGWFSNPTPANAWLIDRDGEWIIAVQGGHQAEGDWPDFGKQWVHTNAGDYGYGCACLRLQANHKTHEVIKIESARVRPLSACRRDRALRKLEPK